MIYIKNERGDIITDTAMVKRIKKKFNEHLYTHKLINL